MKQKIYTDGSGDGRFLWLNVTAKNIKRYKMSGLTNNESEYMAVIYALKENKNDDVDIYSDSQLIVNQISKKWKIKEKRLKKLADEIWKLSENREVKLYWVPRQRNKAGIILEKELMMKKRNPKSTFQ